VKRAWKRWSNEIPTAKSLTLWTQSDLSWLSIEGGETDTNVPSPFVNGQELGNEEGRRKEKLKPERGKAIETSMEENLLEYGLAWETRAG